MTPFTVMIQTMTQICKVQRCLLSKGKEICGKMKVKATCLSADSDLCLFYCPKGEEMFACQYFFPVSHRLGKSFHELKKYEKDIEKTSLQSQRTK